jgi:hypothetical protein
MQSSPSLQSGRSRCSSSLSGPKSLNVSRDKLLRRGRRLGLSARALLDPSEFIQHAQTLAEHLPLAYEPVAAPCSLMNCGDVVHRR